MANRQGHGARGFRPSDRVIQSEALTVKEQRFIEEFLIDTDGAKAARRAGYSGPSAATIACQLLKKPKIKAAISAAMLERSSATRVDARFLLTHLAEMLTADIGDIIEKDGAYKPIHAWPRIWRQMLSGLDVEQIFEYEEPVRHANGIKIPNRSKERKRVEVGRVMKLKFVDRLRVIELLGRHIDIRAFETPIEQHAHLHVYHTASTKELEERFAALTERIKGQLLRQNALEAERLP